MVTVTLAMLFLILIVKVSNAFSKKMALERQEKEKNEKLETNFKRKLENFLNQNEEDTKILEREKNEK